MVNGQPAKKDDFIFGLDIGASKVNLFVGEAGEESIRVIECGDFPLPNPDEFDSVVETLQKAVQMLESSAGIDVHNVYVGIAGKIVASLPSSGMITLTEGSVQEKDMEKVKEQACTLPDSAGILIHKFPGEYTLDGEEHIRNPKGRLGTKLSVNIQIVTARQTALNNLQRCINAAGLEVSGWVLETVAAAYAVLTDDERELGVALIDIGAGSSDIAVFVNDSVRYTASLDYAGNIITSDISKCLGVPISMAKAEEIKIKYGTCVLSNLDEDETFSVTAVGDRGEVMCKKKLLAKVMSARVHEIFRLLAKDLREHNMMDTIGAGVVLTGGCCNIDGIEAIAKKELGTSVRIGRPKGMTGIQDAFQKPSYATGIGLLYHANQQRKKKGSKETGRQIVVSAKTAFSSITESLKRFFKTYF